MKTARWYEVAHALNKISQLAADSRHAAKIGRICSHVRQIIKTEGGHDEERKTFDTRCPCGRALNVTVTLGEPPTFRVNQGGHVCRMWPGACKLIMDRARRVK